jgi:hypothetical protein
MKPTHESRPRNKTFHRADLSREDENPTPEDDALVRHMLATDSTHILVEIH